MIDCGKNSLERERSSLDDVEDAKGEIDKAPHDEDRGKHEAQAAGAQPLDAEEGHQDDTSHPNHHPYNFRGSTQVCGIERKRKTCCRGCLQLLLDCAAVQGHNISLQVGSMSGRSPKE